jgi:hypothetical protein
LSAADSIRSTNDFPVAVTQGLLVEGREGGACEGPVPIDVGVVEGVRTTGSVGMSHCDLPVARWT